MTEKEKNIHRAFVHFAEFSGRGFLEDISMIRGLQNAMKSEICLGLVYRASLSSKSTTLLPIYWKYFFVFHHFIQDTGGVL
jgi:hypothetical protein